MNKYAPQSKSKKNNFSLNVIECVEKQIDKDYTKFKYISSLKIKDNNFQDICTTTRLAKIKTLIKCFTYYYN